LGGALSLYLGISLVSLFELFEIILRMNCFRFKKDDSDKKKKNERNFSGLSISMTKSKSASNWLGKA
jgi:hypothetical protein